MPWADCGAPPRDCWLICARDPERMAEAVELGLVRREWLEHPARSWTPARPVEVLERWLERAVEQRPSTLAALGLSTIQILSSDAEDEAGARASRKR